MSGRGWRRPCSFSLALSLKVEDCFLGRFVENVGHRVVSGCGLLPTGKPLRGRTKRSRTWLHEEHCVCEERDAEAVLQKRSDEVIIATEEEEASPPN